MKEKLKNDMLSMYKEKPMILFSNAADQKLFFDEVAGWLPADLTKVYIESIDDALKRRETEKYETSGLYCFNLKLSRGTDIKLMKDAHVFICAVTGDFPLDEATQMLGRGTRSFGESEGTYYSSTAMKAGNLKRYLKGLERDTKDGARHLKALYDNFSNIPSNLMSHAQAMFSKRKWWISKYEVKNDFRQLFDVLYPNDDKVDNILT